MSVISKLAMLAASGSGGEVIEDVAYVGLYADSQILALNITDPSNVTVLATQTVSTVSDIHLDAENNILYALSVLGRRLYAYDISDPRSFTLLSSVQVASSGFDSKNFGYDPDQQLIVTSQGAIIDASNPSSLSVLVSATRSEYAQITYLRPGTGGVGLFAVSRPVSSYLQVWAINSSSLDIRGEYTSIGIEPKFAVDPTVTPAPGARDSLAFAISSSQQNIKALRPNPVDTGASGFDLRSTATSNLDGAVVAAAYPSQLRVYVADRDNDNYLVTFTYDGNGGSLTYRSRAGSFQEPQGMYVNDTTGLLAVTEYFTAGGARVVIYDLSSPNTPIQLVSYTLPTTESSQDYMPVAIHYYPQA